MPRPKALNIANMLTLGRIFAAPLIVLLMYYPNRMTTGVAFLLFFVASLTDMFDGMIARQTNTITNLGKFLDPLADKLLIGSVLVMLVKLGWAPAWVVIIILCREMTVTGMRAIAAERGVVIAADKYGKIKTILQSLACGLLLLHYPYFGLDPVPFGQVLLYAALVLTVFSGGNYLYNFYKSGLESD